MPFITRSRKRRAPAKRKARRNPKRKAIKRGRHRPTLIYSASGWKAPKRAKLVRKGTRVNPKKATRRRRRRVRRNPNIIKALTSKAVLMQGVTIGGGIIGGSLTMPLMVRFLPASITTDYNKYLGVVNVALGALMVAFLRNKNLKQLGIVIAGTGMYDLVAMNTPIGLPALPRTNAMIEQAFGPATPAVTSASYAVPRLPVSNVAKMAPSLNASYMAPGRSGQYSASYVDPGLSLVGFSGDNPYGDIPGWDD